MKVDKKFPNCARGYKYAEDVVSGEVVACKFIKAACAKFLREIEEDFRPWFFDFDAAEKYLRSVQKFQHVIGHWPTKNIVYEPWQCWVWMNIMGFKNRTTGFRRFRIAHIEIARGNAKSAMASQAALYFLALDNPNGNSISTVATKKDQARIVLDSARAMALKNSSFLKHTGVKVLAHVIVHPKSTSQVRALASEHSGLDGLNDVLGILDELHAMKRDTFEVIYSGMSKRKDSLTLCITTAGHDVHSVGHSQSAYAKKVATEEQIDDQFFAAVYCLDEGDDWEDEAVWIKPNPNLGVSVDIVSLRAKVEKAKITPADVPGLKIKHFNMWIAEAMAFFDLKEWDACYDPTLKLEDFHKKKCRSGLDLAQHIDITSHVLVMRGEDGTYSFWDKNYIPEETVRREQNDIYAQGIQHGCLTETPGAAINYDYIRGEIEELAKVVRLIACLYDSWNATETAQKLSSKVEMVKIGMNVANLSEPMKKFDALMRTNGQGQRKIRHNGSPIFRYCIGNVVAKADHNDNVYPRKSHEKLKIDTLVAALMGLAGWLQDEELDSIYETRGIRTL